MKLLEHPKAIVVISPLNPDINEKSFEYLIGEDYPSKEMIEFLNVLNDDFKKTKFEWLVRTIIYPVEIQLNRIEYFYYKDKLDQFLKLVQDSRYVPKDDITIDDFIFTGCYILPDAIEIDGFYNCKFSVDFIKMRE